MQIKGAAIENVIIPDRDRSARHEVRDDQSIGIALNRLIFKGIDRFAHFDEIRLILADTGMEGDLAVRVPNLGSSSDDRVVPGQGNGLFGLEDRDQAVDNHLRTAQ